MYTSKDGTRRSFGPNFLRKGGAEKSQAKLKRGSCDSCAKEDILNRRYSDDISSKDSRSTSQSASLLMGAQSEPLRRARKVSFQEPEGFHVVRRRLSSITCSGGRGMAMDYTNLGFDSKESSKLDVWTPLVPPCHSNVDNHEVTDSKQNDLPPVFILDSITSDPQMWSQQISGPKYVSKHSDQEQPVNNQGRAGKLSSVSSEPTRDCEPLIFSPIPDGVLDPSSGALNTRNLPLKNKFRPLDFEFKPQWQPRSIPATPAMSRRSLNDSCSKDSSLTGRRSQSVPRRRPPSPPNTPFNIKKDFLHQFPLPQKHGSCSYVTQKNPFANNNNLAESELSSPSSSDSLDLSTLPSRFPDNQQLTMGTLQREMNALFEQKMHEIRCHSPIFFRGKFQSLIKCYSSGQI